MVYNFKKRFVLGLLGHFFHLVGKRDTLRVIWSDQLVTMPDQEEVLVSPHRFFSQMAGLIVKQAVGVTGPGDALHENSKTLSWLLLTYECWSCSVPRPQARQLKLKR